MAATMNFGDILEAADALPLDDQRALASVLWRRASEAGRRRLIDDVGASRAELERGDAKIMTANEIMAALEP